MEIKSVQPRGNKIEYLVLSVKTQEDRNKLYDYLMKQPDLKLETVPQNQITIQWQNGALSNYDYLLYVNR